MFSAKPRMTSHARRVCAATLLLALLLPWVLCMSALRSDPEAQLPACCRSHGKHHCMMSAEQMAALLQGEHFTNIRGKCPLFPHVTAPVGVHTLLAAPAPITLPIGYTGSLIQTAVALLDLRSLRGDQPKRGPPQTFSS